jgi:hypothetical protein
MPHSFYAYGITLLDNGDVFVCGSLATHMCAHYNATLNAWLTFMSLPICIAWFPMITLANGRPYVFGGRNIDNTVFNTTYTLIMSSEWRKMAPMARGLYAHTAVALNDDTAMICGGAITSNQQSAQSLCSTYTMNM